MLESMASNGLVKNILDRNSTPLYAIRVKKSNT